MLARTLRLEGFGAGNGTELCGGRDEERGVVVGAWSSLRADGARWKWRRNQVTRYSAEVTS